jgi:septum formation protein
LNRDKLISILGKAYSLWIISQVTAHMMANFNPISNNNPLILASASPRRKRLLEQVNIQFKTQASEISEDNIEGESTSIVQILAEKKAKAVSHRFKNNWILGADTIVVLEDKILGKPTGPDDALTMLQLLGGREHEVITGFCILDPSGKAAHSDYVLTRVMMKGVTLEELNAYIRTGEPFGKAGSYAIQGVGAFLVESISGSYTNVVGLPVCALIKALLKLRALECFPVS